MSVGDHFATGVPFGRPINPVTKGDWEGKGVEPDVKVSAAEALTTAEKLAGQVQVRFTFFASHNHSGDWLVLSFPSTPHASAGALCRCGIMSPKDTSQAKERVLWTHIGLDWVPFKR
jgi:hypothetical protein